MKIGSAHPRRVTNRAFSRAVTGITGLAAVTVALTPGHASAAVVKGDAVPGTGDDSQAVRHAVRAVLESAAQHSDAALLSYTVRPGDSITGTAVRECHGQAQDWTGIYAASRRLHLTARNANDLRIGQLLAIDCKQVPDMAGRAATIKEPVQTLTSVNVSTGSQKPRSQPSTRAELVRPAEAAVFKGSGAMQQCIIARESGGNSQVMNASGHYGLYQFSYSTWVASGGSPASFGHASVAEQNAVFANAVAARGYSDWTPYDGC